jgi:hypothetical protein
MTSKGYVVEHTNLLTAVTAPPRYGYAYPGDYPSDTGDYTSNTVPPSGYPYYVTYPHFMGTLPFFFFDGRFHPPPPLEPPAPSGQMLNNKGTHGNRPKLLA